MRPIIHRHCTFKTNWGKRSLTLMLSLSQRRAHEMTCKRRWADRSYWHSMKTNTHTHTHVQCMALAAYFTSSTDSRRKFQQKLLPFPTGVLALENESWLCLLLSLSLIQGLMCECFFFFFFSFKATFKVLNKSNQVISMAFQPATRIQKSTCMDGNSTGAAAWALLITSNRILIKALTGGLSFTVHA